MPIPPTNPKPSPRRRDCLLALLAALGACAGPRPSPRATAQPQQAGGSAVSGEEVAMVAMSMIGKPYVWGGASPEVGFDCSGLVHHVYRSATGISLPRQTARLAQTGRAVPRASLLAGDLVFFNTQRRPYSHVGIYVGDGRFVHAPARGKTIRLARLENVYWTRRYDGARRALA